MSSSDTAPPVGPAAAVPIKQEPVKAPIISEPPPPPSSSSSSSSSSSTEPPKPASSAEPTTELTNKAAPADQAAAETKMVVEETKPTSPSISAETAPPKVEAVITEPETKIKKKTTIDEEKNIPDEASETTKKEPVVVVVAAAVTSEKPAPHKEPEKAELKVANVEGTPVVEETKAVQELIAKPEEKKVAEAGSSKTEEEDGDIKHVEAETKALSEEVKTVAEVQPEDVVIEAVVETKAEMSGTEKEEKQEEGAVKGDATNECTKEGGLNKSKKEKALEELKLKVEKYITGTPVKMGGMELAAAATAGGKLTEMETEIKKERLEEEIKEDGEEKQPVDAITDRDVHIQSPSSSEAQVVAIPAEEVEVDLHLWGVPLLHTKGDDRTDVVLLKFLRARDFNPDKAFSMLKKTIMWRKKENADKITEEEFDPNFEKISYMQGTDRNGCPVCYNIFGVFQDKELYKKTIGDDDESVQNFLKWRVQVMEKGIQKLSFKPEGGINSLVQVIDLKDSPGFIQTRKIANKVFKVLQDNYPEFLAKKIVINAPWYYVALPTFAEGVLTARQKSKVIYVRSAKVTETLFEYISPDQVPTKYGGFNRQDETEFVEGVEALIKTEIVNAEKEQVIEFPSVEAGNAVVWDVTIIGWDVKYSETFIPSNSSYSKVIQKAHKISHEHEPIRNSFTATEPGKIELTIDNSASKKKKTVVYRYLVKSE